MRPQPTRLGASAPTQLATRSAAPSPAHPNPASTPSQAPHQALHAVPGQAHAFDALPLTCDAVSQWLSGPHGAAFLAQLAPHLAAAMAEGALPMAAWEPVQQPCLDASHPHAHAHVSPGHATPPYSPTLKDQGGCTPVMDSTDPCLSA